LRPCSNEGLTPTPKAIIEPFFESRIVLHQDIPFFTDI
jgi:hypothetical protein